MKSSIQLRCIFAALVCGSLSLSANSSEQAPAASKSGATYASAEIRALQGDDAVNPGMLWVANGEALWSKKTGAEANSCGQCHGVAANTMRGVATRYPQIEASTKSIINLESRINQCRVKHQGATELAYESAALLGLTAYIVFQSRGMPRQIAIDDANRDAFNRGAALYQQRMGQMNLACTHCHVQNAGKLLLAEKISEGQSNGYPIYRLEWQGMGSLHRRFRSCQVGVRSEPFAPGSAQYLALELYLAWRGGALPIETPAVRR